MDLDKQIEVIVHYPKNTRWNTLNIYGTAHVQVYKLMCVTRRASRNFACNLHVGLVQHKEYTARERLLMSWKYLRVTPVVQFTRE